MFLGKKKSGGYRIYAGILESTKNRSVFYVLLFQYQWMFWLNQTVMQAHFKIYVVFNAIISFCHHCIAIISMPSLHCYHGFHTIIAKLQSNFIKMALRHGCSHINLLHIFRTPFFRNTSRRLLLKIYTHWQKSKVQE